MDKCALAVVQDADFKYVHFAALPPLFFDLKDDPGQFVNRANDPAYAARQGEYAAKMLDWRLGFADRTLTGYCATPNGLEVRAAVHAIENARVHLLPFARMVTARASGN